MSDEERNGKGGAIGRERHPPPGVEPTRSSKRPAQKRGDRKGVVAHVLTLDRAHNRREPDRRYVTTSPPGVSNIACRNYFPFSAAVLAHTPSNGTSAICGPPTARAEPLLEIEPNNLFIPPQTGRKVRLRDAGGPSFDSPVATGSQLF